MAQEYKIGDLSKLISSGSELSESKKKKKDKKLESMFGGSSAGKAQILYVNIEKAESPGPKEKKQNDGAEGSPRQEKTKRGGEGKVKQTKKRKVDEDEDNEDVHKKSKNSAGKKRSVIPGKSAVPHAAGYCPPPGIIHEAVLQQMKTGKLKKDVIAEDPAPKNLKASNVNDDEENENEKEKSRGKQRLNRKVKKLKLKETSLRTVFVGNLPLSVTKKKLQKIFKKYGEIESLRYRCLPPADPKIPKKVMAIKKEFHPERHNCVAYVCYTTEEAAQKALKSNGMQVQDLHIQVDLASRSKEKDKSRSVFVGNIPFEIEEEAVRNHFLDCGKIENVRVIRERKTGLGKGFCFVLFESKDSVSLALKLNNSVLQKRELRVTRCSEESLKKGAKKSGHMNAKGAKLQPSRGTDRPTTKTFLPSNQKSSSFQGLKVQSSKDKKKKLKKRAKKQVNPFHKSVTKILPSKTGGKHVFFDNEPT